MINTHLKIADMKGAGLIHVLILLATVGVLLEESIRILTNQNNVLQIMRMNQRLAISNDWVATVSKSSVALQKSAEQPENLALKKCLIDKDCSTIDIESFSLYDAFGQLASGFFHLDGRPCETHFTSCPISIETKVSFQCPEGLSRCPEPEAIHTFYVVEKNPQLNPENFLSARPFKRYENEVILASFTCPKGEYVRGIAENGALQCAKPRFAAGVTKCDTNMVPTGILANGMITECVPAENLCKQPLAIATVLDTSGSMMGSKIQVARNVLKDFISSYDSSKDKGSLTTFSTGAKKIVEPTDDKSKLKGATDSQQASGSTNMGAGLIAGAQTLANEKNSYKVMVFISDGMNNTGDQNVGAIADNLKKQGIRIITVGFGRAADPVTLRRIASPGDNFIAPINADLSNIFGDIKSLLCRQSP